MARTRTALLLGGAVLFTVAVYGGSYALVTTRNSPVTLDVGPVPGAAEQACTRLRTELDALPALPGAADAAARQERVAVQDASIRGLVGAVRAVGAEALADDVPAEQWLADWEQLARARQAWAQAGATGAFTAPVEDGRPITDRMGAVGISSCVVPTGLTTAP